MSESRKDLCIRIAWGAATLAFGYALLSDRMIGGYTERGVELIESLYAAVRCFSSIPATKFP